MLKVLDINSASEWDEIAASFKNHDIYHLSGYVRPFMLHGDGLPVLFYYEDEGVRGINVVMKRDIAECPYFAGKLENNKLFDLIVPYGYGGWLIEGEGNADTLFSEYFAYCKANNIVCEFVRFHPLLENMERTSAYYNVIPLGHTVAIEMDSPEGIWARFTSQNRNKIKKARNNGVVIKHGMSMELYEDFRKIYNSTMDDDAAIDYYYFKPEFYSCMYEELKDRSEIFYAEREDRIIAASIMLFENDYMTYHLSGSYRDSKVYAPTNLLLYEAALWGCEKGFRTMHLGGGLGCREDNLFEFKKGFHRGEHHLFGIAKKIFDETKYRELSVTRGVVKNPEFFPVYRAE